MMRKETLSEEEKKDEESVSFLPTTTGKPKFGNGNGHHVPTATNHSAVHNNGVLCYLYQRHKPKFAAALVVVLIGFVFWSNDRSAGFEEDFAASSSAAKPVGIEKDEDGIIRFSCPSLDYAVNTQGENFEEYYTSVTREITDNKTEFLSTFRTAEFDGWGKSYTKIKKGSKPFKEKYYPKYLKEGSHLYESACGIGLNLYMTLEIVRPITGITVYGNEYVPESAEKARRVVLADGVIPAGNRQGTICAGDSTNLTHVPSGAFDLVYTGYLTPNMDTLGLHPEDPEFDDWGAYDDLCDAYRRYQNNIGSGNDNNSKTRKKDRLRKNDWMGNYLWNVMVERQRDWYGRWVSEMARIAKPGVPVIVEQVSIPYCLNQYDWGGVVKEWWHEAAEKNTYGWNVDPDSIEMMDDTIHEHRYHVFMLKNE